MGVGLIPSDCYSLKRRKLGHRKEYQGLSHRGTDRVRTHGKGACASQGERPQKKIFHDNGNKNKQMNKKMR